MTKFLNLFIRLMDALGRGLSGTSACPNYYRDRGSPPSEQDSSLPGPPSADDADKWAWG